MAFSYWALSVKIDFSETFQRISEVWRNAQALNLGKCLIFLSSITLQFLNFFHWTIFFLFCLLRDSENDLYVCTHVARPTARIGRTCTSKWVRA